MRLWLFHPLVFYPLAILFAAGLILISLAPQAWPRAPELQAGEIQNGAVVLETGAFTAPATGDGQSLYVTRDIWGDARYLHIAVEPNRGNPTPGEQGVRILLKPATAALLQNRPVTLEVTYNPVAVNAATGLAASLEGDGPSNWVSQSIAAQTTTVRFQLPARATVDAIGLRAISTEQDQAYGVEIVRIRAIPGSPLAGG
ncbi:MAG: hypothetical protein ABUL73_02160 [Alphaproteobacteria bacterium]